MEDSTYRGPLLAKILKKIQKKAKNNILVLDYGDLLHNGFHIKPVLIYTKNEVVEIFRSHNKELIKSLIDNSIVEKLRFNKAELEELTHNLKISLIEQLDKPKDEFDEIHFH